MTGDFAWCYGKVEQEVIISKKGSNLLTKQPGTVLARYQQNICLAAKFKKRKKNANLDEYDRKIIRKVPLEIYGYISEGTF